MKSSIKRLVYLACVILSFQQSALAQETTVGKEGNFSIITIKVNGKFDRCTAATGGTLNQQLRIAVNTAGDLGFSFPSYPNSPLGVVKITIDGQTTLIQKLAGRSDVRAWITPDNTLENALSQGKKSLLVEYGVNKLLYALNSDMKGLIGTLRSCMSVQNKKR